MKLMSMTAFVLDINAKIEAGEMFELYGIDLIFNYAKFLKQPLKLEMFVNSDEDDNVLFDFHKVEVWESNKERFRIKINHSEDYYEVREFETDDTVEDLLNIFSLYDWKLTENALKQIGL